MANFGRDGFPPSLLEKLRKRWYKLMDDTSKYAFIAETLASRDEWKMYGEQIPAIFEKMEA